MVVVEEEEENGWKGVIRRVGNSLIIASSAGNCRYAALP